MRYKNMSMRKIMTAGRRTINMKGANVACIEIEVLLRRFETGSSATLDTAIFCTCPPIVLVLP